MNVFQLKVEVRYKINYQIVNPVYNKCAFIDF